MNTKIQFCETRLLNPNEKSSFYDSSLRTSFLIEMSSDSEGVSNDAPGGGDAPDGRCLEKLVVSSCDVITDSTTGDAAAGCGDKVGSSSSSCEVIPATRNGGGEDGGGCDRKASSSSCEVIAGGRGVGEDGGGCADNKPSSSCEVITGDISPPDTRSYGISSANTGIHIYANFRNLKNVFYWCNIHACFKI
jgi:hypothetical protein